MLEVKSLDIPAVETAGLKMIDAFYLLFIYFLFTF